MTRPFSGLAALLCSSSLLASTVIYTDSCYPVISSGTDISVVLLDAPEQLQARLFGALSADPGQAEQQAQRIIVSEDFLAQQTQLELAYEGLLTAWMLGLKKYPAVVFDEQWVVYGTTDVAEARRRLAHFQEGAP